MNVWLDKHGAQLRAAVLEPFSKRVPPPNKEAIAPGVHDDDRSACELLWRHSMNFTESEMKELAAYLPLLSSAAFLYFLPGFLLAAWEERGTFLTFLLYNLDAPPNWPTVRAKRIKIYSQLNSDETNIVRAFLEAVTTLEGDFSQDAEDVLSNYWVSPRDNIL